MLFSWFFSVCCLFRVDDLVTLHRPFIQFCFFRVGSVCDVLFFQGCHGSLIICGPCIGIYTFYVVGASFTLSRLASARDAILDAILSAHPFVMVYTGQVLDRAQVSRLGAHVSR